MILMQTLAYIVTAPFFWVGMGMVIASGMFVGATIYNGELNLLRKGLWTIFFYVLFLLIINIARVLDSVTDTYTSWHFAWASTTTIIITTIAYALGMIMGVWITKIAHKGVRYD